MSRNIEIEANDSLACTKCGKRDGLIVSGLSLLPYSGLPEHAGLNWAVECWTDGCNRASYHINDEARDELFGTGWRRS